MFVMDMPDISPQYAPVVIAQAPQTQQGVAKTDRAIGVCQVIANPATPSEPGGISAVNGMGPMQVVINYFRTVEHREISGPGKVSVLQNPSHGTLKDFGDDGYFYFPTSDYLGEDRAVLLVEIGGYKVNATYFFHVQDSFVTASDREISCPKYYWKISLNPDDPNAPIYTFQHPSQLTSYLAGVINVDIQIADLAGGAVGQTTATTITLDDNAAGHGWFLDTTPGDNAEFLPTHNPNEWVAKEGSAAAGKLDLLSVLLHEYGHVLGIDHSADNHDYMATTLTPGVRRLPSPEELTLMADLVGQVM